MLVPVACNFYAAVRWPYGQETSPYTNHTCAKPSASITSFIPCVRAYTNMKEKRKSPLLSRDEMCPLLLSGTRMERPRSLSRRSELTLAASSFSWSELAPRRPRTCSPYSCCILYRRKQSFVFVSRIRCNSAPSLAPNCFGTLQEWSGS